MNPVVRIDLGDRKRESAKRVLKCREHPSLRLVRRRQDHHPPGRAISVKVRVKQNCASAAPPSCPTRSISTNPGTALSQSRPSPGSAISTTIRASYATDPAAQVSPAPVQASERSSTRSSALAVQPPRPSGSVPRPGAARARAPASSAPASFPPGPAAPPSRSPAPRSPVDHTPEADADGVVPGHSFKA